MNVLIVFYGFVTVVTCVKDLTEGRGHLSLYKDSLHFISTHLKSLSNISLKNLERRVEVEVFKLGVRSGSVVERDLMDVDASCLLKCHFA